MVYLTGFHAIEEHIKSGKAAGPLLTAKPGPRAWELAALAVERKIRVDRVGTHGLDHLAPDHRSIALAVEEAGEWLDSLDASALKKIFLVHGEKKAQAAFQQYLNGKGYRAEIVRYGKTYGLSS